MMPTSPLSGDADPLRSRRAFLGAMGGAIAAASFPSFAQQQLRALHRIGFLGSESASNQAKRLEAFRVGLRELGYAEGRNIAIEVRWAEGEYDRLPALAAELAGLKLGAIVVSGSKATLAMQRATSTIPIVMGSTGDPVGLGLLSNLARPGGNITGSANLSSEFAAKRLELLKEAMPRISKVAFLVNPAYPPAAAFSAMEPVAMALKLGLQQFEASGPGEFASTFAAMKQKHVDAVVVQGDTLFAVNAKAIAALALRQRLPSAGSVEFAMHGGLIGNGPDQLEGHRRAATFVDKILKGANPGDLPIERATRFHLVINFGTAKALGLALPQTLRLRADEVIE